MRIRITAGTVTAEAELFDTPTGRAIGQALPITAEALTWGDEIYFEIPVRAGLEPEARDVVDKGDLGYWPTGRAFCVFFGPTPASRGDEIRAASAVNVVGRVLGETAPFRQVREGSAVQITSL